jgi:hypothetical protein
VLILSSLANLVTVHAVFLSLAATIQSLYDVGFIRVSVSRYPFVTSTVLSFFQCEEVNGRLYLVQDFTLPVRAIRRDFNWHSQCPLHSFDVSLSFCSAHLHTN